MDDKTNIFSNNSEEKKETDSGPTRSTKKMTLKDLEVFKYSHYIDENDDLGSLEIEISEFKKAIFRLEELAVKALKDSDINLYDEKYLEILRHADELRCILDKGIIRYVLANPNAVFGFEGDINPKYLELVRKGWDPGQLKVWVHELYRYGVDISDLDPRKWNKDLMWLEAQSGTDPRDTKLSQINRLIIEEYTLEELAILVEFKHDILMNIEEDGFNLMKPIEYNIQIKKGIHRHEKELNDLKEGTFKSRLQN